MSFCVVYRLVGECTGKGLLTACDNDSTNALIAVILAQGVVELGKEWAAESVQCLRAVQGDYVS